MKNTYVIALLFTVLFISDIQSSTASQTASSFTTASRFDTAGRKVGTIQPDPDGSGSLHFAATRTSYNTQGLVDVIESGELLSWQTDSIKPLNWSGFTVHSSVVHHYDSLGRLIGKSSRDNNNVTFQFVQMNYDEHNRRVCTAKRMNAATFDNLSLDACVPTLSAEHGYDRITKSTYADFDMPYQLYKAYGTSLQQVYRTTKYFHHSPGLVESVSDAKYNKTSYQYDIYNNIDRIDYPVYGESNSGYWGWHEFETFTYDPDGNLLSHQRRSGEVIDYEYDNLNQRTDKITSDSAQRGRYKYDGRGLLLESIKGQYGSISRIKNTYDARGNLATSTTADGYYLNQRVRTISHTYDANGNRKTITHPDGVTFTYEFDGLNRIDSLKNPANIPLVNINYNARGSRDGITRDNNVDTHYLLNDKGQVSSFSQSFLQPLYNLTNTFTYNPSNQVTEITNSNMGYQYHGQDLKVGTYRVNNLNQYLSVDSQTMSHDKDGNMTNDGDRVYGYDLENRLVDVTGDNNAQISYDANGRLYSTNIDGDMTYYVFDGDALIATYDANGLMKQRIIHGDQVDEPLIRYEGSTISSGAQQFYHSDYKGSVIAISNASGHIVKTNAYDEYGVPATINDTLFAYTGQLYLKELGLYYYKARIYHPKLGRFLQTDPVGYEDQMNLYAYVANDPVNNVDPTGMCISDPLSAAFCAGLAVAIYGLGDFVYTAVSDDTYDTSIVDELIDKASELCAQGDDNACILAEKFRKQRERYILGKANAVAGSAVCMVGTACGGPFPRSATDVAAGSLTFTLTEVARGTVTVTDLPNEEPEDEPEEDPEE